MPSSLPFGWEITLSCISVAAILLSPVIALWVQNVATERKERTARRLHIFTTLMTTRGFRLSQQHVQALNQIELEFRERKDAPIIDAWKSYHSILSIPEKDRTNDWGLNVLKQLVELLYQMALPLGYSYTRVDIEKSWYAPDWYAQADQDGLTIRKRLIDLLEGQRPLGVMTFDGIALANATEQSKPQTVTPANASTPKPAQ